MYRAHGDPDARIRRDSGASHTRSGGAPNEGPLRSFTTTRFGYGDCGRRLCRVWRSVLISSNLVFSQWDQIFKDPMTTACAIDRVVHHATILELTGSSYRNEAAKQRNGGRGAESGAPPPKEAEA